MQVIDRMGKFMKEFGKGILKQPSGLHIAETYVYVSDLKGYSILVYKTSAQYVTLFGRSG